MGNRYTDNKVNDLSIAISNMAEYSCKKNLCDADLVIRSMLFEQSAKSFIAQIKQEIKEELRKEIKDELAKERKQNKLNF